jgi:hypothetical protein
MFRKTVTLAAAIGLNIVVLSTVALAQTPPAAAPGGEGKENANPCRDEVSAALTKLRKSSWFRMNTSMLTDQGPTSMEIEYVLPDRMHQKVTVLATQSKSEIILVGNDAWSREGDAKWKPMSNDYVQQLKTQMQESVVDQQTDVGNYSCKGRTTFEGKDVLSYKLEDEPQKDSTAPKNETVRMFYVDAVTGLPVSNALIVPGREAKPLFKASYNYPLDMKIEAPKEVATP